MKKVEKIILNKNIQLDCDGKLSGSLQNEGCYKCCNCGQKIYLDKPKKLPRCPKCNCNIFEFVA